MLTDAVATRLKDQVAALDKRTQSAADLAEMIRQKTLPNAPVSAFVISGGLRPVRGGESMSGAFTQELSEVIAIVLVVRTAGDATGGKSLPTLDELVKSVVVAVAGWTPPDLPDEEFVVIGDFSFERGQLVQLNAGVIYYQVELSCPLQLRVLT